MVRQTRILQIYERDSGNWRSRTLPYVAIIGQKANRKLNALRKIANCMELPRNRVLMNAVFYNKI